MTMTKQQMEYLAATAARRIKTLYGKSIDEAIAYSVIDNFLTAYKERTRSRYTGEIELADLMRGLNTAYNTGKLDLFVNPAPVIELFAKKTREEAARITFADAISFLCSKAIAAQFGI